MNAHIHVHVYVCYLKVCHRIKSVDGCGPFMAIASYVGRTCYPFEIIFKLCCQIIKFNRSI